MNAQVQQRPRADQIIAALSTDPYSMPLRQKGSKKCHCGKTISENAFACQECSLIYIDRAITEMDAATVKAAAAGDFEKATEHAKAETKLRQFREAVRKGHQKKI